MGRSAAGARPIRFLVRIGPGILLTGGIAASSSLLHGLPALKQFSPLILAILIGMLFRGLAGRPVVAVPGVAFAMSRVLRFAIMLLGLQITTEQVIAVGAEGLLITVTTLVATFLFTIACGRAMGVERKLTELIAAGTAICGASAILATNTVTRAREEDVAYAVGCVTVFGSAAMFLYPAVSPLLGLDSVSYGLWAGGSIHEIAQVVGAAFQGGTEAGELATVTKLSRVMLLAPMILALAVLGQGSSTVHSGSGRRIPVPWFVFGFAAVVVANSFGVIPAGARSALVTANVFLLAMALAAMGLETDARKIVRQGPRPLFLGAASTVFVAGVSLALIGACR